MENLKAKDMMFVHIFSYIHAHPIILVQTRLLLFLVFLIFLALGQLARPDDLGLMRWGLERSERSWDEHADLFLIFLVLGILSTSNGFSKPR